MIYDSRRLEYIGKTIGKSLIMKNKKSHFYKFDDFIVLNITCVKLLDSFIALNPKVF